MPSNIDTTKPVYGNPTTQSVRDNFTTAKTEINDLQVRTAQAPYLPIAGGIMDGTITMQTDPLNPYEVATKRYVDNLAFGTSGGIGEAPTDGMFYARGQVAGGATWSKTPLFQNIHIGPDSANDLFNIGSDATYNYIKFLTATPDYLRFNRATKQFDLVTNNVIAQSWATTGVMFYPPVTTNSTLTVNNNLIVYSATPTLRFNSPAASDKYIYFEANSLKRWALGVDAANSHFGLFNYNASGTIIGKPLHIGVAIPSGKGMTIDGTGNVGFAQIPPATESAGGNVHVNTINTLGWFGNIYYDGTNYRTKFAGYGFLTLTNAGTGNLWAWMTTPSVAAGAITAAPQTVMQLSATGSLAVINYGAGTNGINVNNTNAGISLQLQNTDHARVHYQTSGKHWSAGVLTSGEFYIADELNATGYMTLSNNLVQTPMDIYCSGPRGICFSIGGQGSYIALAINSPGWACSLAFNGGWDGFLIRSFYSTPYEAYTRSMLNGANATVGIWWGGSAENFAYWSFSWSDRKLKWNIKPSAINAVDTINKLNIISCDTKFITENSEELHWDCAIIADEIQDIIPGAYIKAPDAKTDKDEVGALSYDSVREMPLICTALKAIQELSQRLATLEHRR